MSGRDVAATALNRVFSSRHENCNHESRCGREAFQLNYVTKAVCRIDEQFQARFTVVKMKPF